MKKQEKENEKQTKSKTTKDKKDWVDKWLEFFEHYKEH